MKEDIEAQKAKELAWVLDKIYDAIRQVTEGSEEPAIPNPERRGVGEARRDDAPVKEE